MTVPSNIAKTQHSGNGTAVAFSTGFVFQNNAEVRVVLTSATGIDQPWTEGVEYTLTGAGTNMPGTVTAATAPASGTTLTILRDMPFTQTLDAGMLETLAASELEDTLDGIVMCLTQLKEKVDRAITSSETGGAAVVTGWSPQFTVAPDSARQVLRVTDWVGGTNPKPDVGLYVGPSGMVNTIAAGADIRGAQGNPGASGSGSGDVVAAQNLNDLANKATAFANIKQAATDTATGVVELATTAEALAGVDTTRVVTPVGLSAAIAAVAITPVTFGELFGCKLSNAADTANDITVAVGKAVDLTTGYVMQLTSPLTKRLDATWSAGTNQGGRDSGSIADGTWHVHLIGRTDTGATDVIFSIDELHPVKPAPQWDCARRIGSIIRRSATILQFNQLGDEFLWLVTNGDVSVTNLGLTAAVYTLSVPLNIRVHALLRGQVSSTGSAVLITSLDENDQAPENPTWKPNYYRQYLFFRQLKPPHPHQHRWPDPRAS